MTSAPTASFQQTADSEVTERVLEAVAAREGTSATDLNRPLYEVVDPDALNALFSGGKSPDSVRFTYLGYRIEIRGSERIDVTAVDGNYTDRNAGKHPL